VEYEGTERVLMSLNEIYPDNDNRKSVITTSVEHYPYLAANSRSALQYVVRLLEVSDI
jgi:hypothetical protein